MHKKTLSDTGGADTAPPAIYLKNIYKSFGAVQANKDIDLHVSAGTIHGIVGENGAGKSTLVSILYGFYTADRGKTEIFGAPVVLRSTADAIAAGIGMVHQHFMLVPNFSVLENIILGHEGSSSLQAGLEKATKELQNIADKYGLQVDLHALVQDLPVGLQQRVEILKALYRGARVLILDEPTGVLTPQETKQLFEILRSLRAQGVTILLITHKLKEIMAVTDNVSVMRGGEMVAHLETPKTSPEQLAELMVGRPVLLTVGYDSAEAGDICLQVEHLSMHDDSGKSCLQDISFSVRRGEIFGIAGVSGNGQSELLEVLAGISALDAGRVVVGTTEISADNPATPAEVKELGLAHIPEDRHAMGLILPFTAAETAMLGYEERGAVSGRSPFLSPDKITRHCAKLMTDFDIRPADPNLKSNLFSGGNQQKIVVAREISAHPDILLVGQPTRGVDIGAIEFIHKQLLALRDAGCAIILVSVELDEILNLSDRIMVMNAGQNMGILVREDADVQNIGMMMAGLENTGNIAASLASEKKGGKHE
jgi:simple sugar transport system ATP-binding protein